MMADLRIEVRNVREQDPLVRLSLRQGDALRIKVFPPAVGVEQGPIGLRGQTVRAGDSPAARYPALLRARDKIVDESRVDQGIQRVEAGCDAVASLRLWHEEAQERPRFVQGNFDCKQPLLNLDPVAE